MRILVTGMHRSGTSLATQLINAMGAEVGPESMLMKPMPDNPRGFWERRDVAALNEAVLQARGCSWDAPVSTHNTDPPQALVERREELLHRMDSHRPWVAKDPRLCLTLDFWLASKRSFHVVVVHRNPVEIAKSLKARNKFSIQHGVALWEYYLKRLYQNLRDAGCGHTATGHQELMTDLAGVADRVLDDLSRRGDQSLHRPTERVLEEIVDPTLRNQLADERDLSTWLRPEQLALHKAVDDPATCDIEPTPWCIDLLQGMKISSPLPAPTDPDALAHSLAAAQTSTSEQLERMVLQLTELTHALAAAAEPEVPDDQRDGNGSSHRAMSEIAVVANLASRLSGTGEALTGLSLSWGDEQGSLAQLKRQLAAARHLAHSLRTHANRRTVALGLRLLGGRKFRSELTELRKLLDAALVMRWADQDIEDLDALASEVTYIASQLIAHALNSSDA